MRITGLPNFRHDLETPFSDHYVSDAFTVIVADNEMHFMYNFGTTYTFKKKDDSFVYGSLSLNDGVWLFNGQLVDLQDPQDVLEILESIRIQAKLGYAIATLTLLILCYSGAIC